MTGKPLKSLAVGVLALTLGFMFFMRLVWIQSRKATVGPSCNGISALSDLAQGERCSGRDNREFLERLEDWRSIPEASACSEQKGLLPFLKLRLAYRCRMDQLSDGMIFMDQLALYFAGVALWMILCRVWTGRWLFALAIGTMLMSRGSLLAFLTRIDDWMETNVCLAIFFLAGTFFYKHGFSFLPLAFLGLLELFQNSKLGWVTGAFLFFLVPQTKKAFGSKQAVLLSGLSFLQFLVPTLQFLPKASPSWADAFFHFRSTDLHWPLSLLALIAFLAKQRGEAFSSWQAQCFRRQIAALLVGFVTAILSHQMIYFDRLSAEISSPLPLEPAILVMGAIALVGFFSPRISFRS